MDAFGPHLTWPWTTVNIINHTISKIILFSLFLWLLSVCNNLSPNLVTCTNKHLFSLSFYGLGIWQWHRWWYWIGTCPGVAVRMLAGDAVIWRLNWIWMICFHDGSLAWLLDVVLTGCVIASCRFLITWQLAVFRVRVTQVTAPFVRCYSILVIPIIRSESLSPAKLKQRELYSTSWRKELK